MTINSNSYQNMVNLYHNADKRQNSAENLQEQDVSKVIEKRNDDLRRESSDVPRFSVASVATQKNNVSQTLNSYSAEQLSKVHDISKISMNVLDISI